MWTIIKGLIAPFIPSAATLVLYGGIAVAVLGGVTWWSVHQFNKGWQAAIASVAAQDKEAVNAVNDALIRVRECRVSGGVWRPSSGQCEGR